MGPQKQRFFFGLASLFWVWTSCELAVASTDIQIPFGCSQALAGHTNPKLPVNALFTLSYDFKSPATLNWDQWRSVAKAADEGPIDYFDCLLGFQREVRIALLRACKKEAAKGGAPGPARKKCASETVPAMMSELNLFHARLGQSTWDRHAIPLYPPGVAISELSGTPLLSSDEGKMRSEEAIEDLTDSCSVGSAWEMTSDFVKSELPKALAKTPSDCKNLILKSYLSKAAYLQPDPSFCENHSHPVTCEYFKVATERFINGLRPFFPKVLMDELTPIQVEACLKNPADISAFLRSLQSETDGAISCLALRPGESRVVDTENVGTGVGAHYVLSRNAQGGGYTATINVRYLPRALHGEWVKKANECLEKMGDSFRTSSSEPIQVRVSDFVPGRPQILPPPTSVSITDVTGHRNNSEEWHETIDCDTMSHELLHKMGLADEYPEDFRGILYDPMTQVWNHVESRDANPETMNSAFFSDFDCRFVGPKDSIMYDQHAVQPIVPFVGGRCICPKELTLAACNALFDAMPKKPDSCPQGVQTMLYDHTVPSRQSPAPIGTSGLVVLERSGRKLEMMINLPKITRPKLQPAQFRALTLPGCNSVNATYYACAQNSYATSRAHLGKGCSKGLPAVCSQPEEWLK